MIYLCGAGCGDMMLLTLKAKHCIQKADCILYDHLVDPAVLSLAKKDCEMMYVGKQNRNHSVVQADINALLIEKGKQYLTVVRLKGGDPYVFGRGGEEALALYDAQMRFEVIPGISSSIGGLAYAGIPITHRDCCNGVRIMSAHNKKDELADLDFHSMANTKDTLVFLMSLSTIECIVKHLLEAGKAQHTPIALISHASRSQQRVVKATLQSILAVDRTGIVSPTMIVVGDVVAYGNKLNFFEKRPLFHKRYLVPVFEEHTCTIKEELEEQGAEVIQLVCGKVQERKYALQDVSLENYQYIVFTSKKAIDYFFSQLLEGGRDVRCLSHIRLCAIGKQTANHLLTYGLRADIISSIADSEHMGEALMNVIKQGEHILLAKADNQNNTLFERLQSYAHVTVIALYKTIPLDFSLPQQRVDGILFSCSFHVREVMKKLKEWDHYKEICMYSIGHQTSTTLRLHGVSQIKELPKAQMSLFINEVLKEA